MTEPIGKGATDPGNFREPMFFYASAREGMQDFLEHGAPSRRRDVLLPAFIGWSPREGSGVLDPVRAAGRQAAFYDLNPDLTVDLSALADQLDRHDFHAVLLIHYFGRIDGQLAAVRRLCDDHGAVLIEDLAHGFLSRHGTTAATGDRGHLQLFSLHKLFAMPSGGAVRYEDDSLVDHQMSSAPGVAAQLLSYDWEGISQRRRQTFVEMTSALQALPENGHLFEILWPELRDEEVPQTLPIRTLTGRRDTMYEELNARGIGVVSLYHTLVDEVGAEFPGLMDLSRCIINLPVHQDVDPRQVSDVVRAFQQSLHAH